MAPQQDSSQESVTQNDTDIEVQTQIEQSDDTIALTDAAAANFVRVRDQSTRLCAPLETEDYGVQPMADASPPKWHLAHTSWFFETFILKPYCPDYDCFNTAFEHLFNSYYNGVGQPFARTRRGHLSRPTVAEVYAYRKHVDDRILDLLKSVDSEHPHIADIQQRLELGLHHEQQHQELLLTDVKFNFGHNPLFPAYLRHSQDETNDTGSNEAGPSRETFVTFDGGVFQIGASEGFAFDNELPRHETLVQPFALANRLVTNAEYRQFIEDGGYERADLWLSDGWAILQQETWRSPLYWQLVAGEWYEYRCDGLHPLVPDLPVIHVSAHEAFAYAQWRGLRLPTEFEWEVAAQGVPITGSFVESGQFHPNSCVPDSKGAPGLRSLSDNSSAQTPSFPPGENRLQQMYGEAWQWTSSSYGAYPGYRPLPGTLGEYNGKFMSSQLVLHGGSCVSAREHLRASYRNFFYPPDRWQFTGIRLAQDV